MARSIFVCGTSPEAGGSIIALGLMAAMRRTVGRIGFFKPVGSGPDDSPWADSDVELIRKVFALTEPAEQQCAVSLDEAERLTACGKGDELCERVAHAYARVAERNDLVILEGINQHPSHALQDTRICAQIAAHLGTPVLLVARAESAAEEAHAESLANSVTLARRLFEELNGDVLGVVVNRVRSEPLEPIAPGIRRALEAAGHTVFGVVPELKVLGRPYLDQIAQALEAKVILGGQNLRNIASRVVIGAMTPINVLKSLTVDQTLVITPADRDAIIMALALSQVSPAYRTISGMVLAGGYEPQPSIIELVHALGEPRYPILLTGLDPYMAAARVNEMVVRVRAQDEKKLVAAESAVARYVEQDRILAALKLSRPRASQKNTFLDGIIEQARALRRRIVFPEGDEPRTLQAVARLQQMGVVRCTLLGEQEKIRNAARELGVDVAGAEIVNPARDERLERYVQSTFELRRNKPGGMTLETARQWVEESRVHFGTLMVHHDDADGLVSGAVHSTADTIRPALMIIRVRPEIGICSSVFFMVLRDRVLVYGDCAIVPNPNARELAAIAVSSAMTARRFGIEPRVAMLSYSTGKSGAGESVDKVSEATRMVKERHPDLMIDGPLQYDAAIDPDVARLKQPGSPVAGSATVFIFPDLDAGNIAYKAVQRSAGAIAVGPVLQGLNKPVNDLSRGCSVDDLFYTAAITAIQAGRS